MGDTTPNSSLNGMTGGSVGKCSSPSSGQVSLSGGHQWLLKHQPRSGGSTPQLNRQASVSVHTPSGATDSTAALMQMMADNFKKMDEKFDKMENKICQKMDERFDKIYEKLDKMNEKMEKRREEEEEDPQQKACEKAEYEMEAEESIELETE